MDNKTCQRSYQHILFQYLLQYVQFNFGKLKLAVEEVRKGTSKREVKGMRLVSVLWH